MSNNNERRFWVGKSVLVTGASGLLGGWLVKDLISAGANVVALVRDRVPKSMLCSDGLLDQIAVVNGDIGDAHLLARTMTEYEVDTVFHLAAQAIVGVAKVNPVATLEANIRGTWNVLEAARNSGIARVVVASSDKAYGVSEQLPYRETDPLQGTYPYDVSKSCTDLISRMYAVTYKLPVAIVRCANLFGGGDLNFSRTIPGAVAATLRGEPFVIRSDGKFVRDLLYVKDASLAYLRVAEALTEDPLLAGEAFNFSLELRLTVLQVAEHILKLMHRTDLRPSIMNIASSEIREQYLSCEKAATVLGWSPRFTFEEGLRETIAWYERYFAASTSNVRAAIAV